MEAKGGTACTLEGGCGRAWTLCRRTALVTGRQRLGWLGNGVLARVSVPPWCVGVHMRPLSTTVGEKPAAGNVFRGRIGPVLGPVWGPYPGRWNRNAGEHPIPTQPSR